MTSEELQEAIDRLIGEANVQTEEVKAAYERDVLQAKHAALSRRIFRSCILEEELAQLREAYEALVLRIQKDLDESIAALQTEEDPVEGGSGGEDAPYEVDYTLPMRERYIIVKNYYLGYEDMEQALADLQQDEVAEAYLGTYYAYLVQLLSMIRV